MRYLIFACLVTFALFSCTGNLTQEKNITQKDSVTSPKDSAIKKNDTPAIAATLTITPLNNNGDEGQVTFSRQGKTLFYYNLKTKKGEININGTQYLLDTYSFDAKTNSYTLSGKEVKIAAPDFKYVNDEGSGACNYGNAPVATVALGSSILKVDKVEVQDCPE